MNFLTAAFLSFVLAAIGGASFFHPGSAPAAPSYTTNIMSATLPPTPTPAPTATPNIHPHGPGNPNGPGGGGHVTCPPGWYPTASDQCEQVNYI